MSEDRPKFEPERPCESGSDRDFENQARLALELGALRAAGEIGYRRLTVKAITGRSGVSRTRFYGEFSDKTDCYDQAYAGAVDCLFESILRAGAAAPDWATGFRRALTVVAGFLTAEPAVAKGLLAEVHVAGGAAHAKRTEIFERLADAIDCARRVDVPIQRAPPPITGAFTLNAVEAALIWALIAGKPADFTAAIPDLTYLAVSFYFGEEAGRKVIADTSD